MGAMDAQNTYSNLAVNEYLHTVASRWISSTYQEVKFISTEARKWNEDKKNFCFGNVNLYINIFKYLFLERGTVQAQLSTSA